MSMSLPKWMVGGSPITKAILKATHTEDLSLSRQLTKPAFEYIDPPAETTTKTAVDKKAVTSPEDMAKMRGRRRMRSLATMYAQPDQSPGSLGNRWSGP